MLISDDCKLRSSLHGKAVGRGTKTISPQKSFANFNPKLGTSWLFDLHAGLWTSLSIFRWLTFHAGLGKFHFFFMLYDYYMRHIKNSIIDRCNKFTKSKFYSIKKGRFHPTLSRTCI